MDPYRFTYSPVVERPKLSWPNGARVAVWVCPNIEHYEYLPAEVRVRNPWPRMPHPDVLGYGGRDYGNRVGLWRMFEVLDKHNVRCTVSLSMSVIEMYPEILEAMEARPGAPPFSGASQNDDVMDNEVFPHRGERGLTA